MSLWLRVSRFYRCIKRLKASGGFFLVRFCQNDTVFVGPKLALSPVTLLGTPRNLEIQVVLKKLIKVPIPRLTVKPEPAASPFLHTIKRQAIPSEKLERLNTSYKQT